MPEESLRERVLQYCVPYSHDAFAEGVMLAEKNTKRGLLLGPLGTQAGLRCAFVLFLALCSLGLRAEESPSKVRLLLHPELQTQDISQAKLRAIMSLRIRRWEDGTPVRIFVLQDASPLHTQFCKELMGTFPYVLRRTWDEALFAGTGLIPETVSDVAEMRRRVQETPGALGYDYRPALDVESAAEQADIASQMSKELMP